MGKVHVLRRIDAGEMDTTCIDLLMPKSDSVYFIVRESVVEKYYLKAKVWCKLWHLSRIDPGN